MYVLCRASQLAGFAAVILVLLLRELDIVLLNELNVFGFFGSVSYNLNTVGIFCFIVGFLA